MEQLSLDHGPEEFAEIERHKYFRSEQAGHDVGWEFAERDWEEHFGRQFRQLHAADTQVVSRGIRPFLKRVRSIFTSKNR